jgi:hypothetical protein
MRGVQQTSEENRAIVEIASATGTKVFGEEIDCEGCAEIEVRLSRNLAPGIYMVHVVINGERLMKRLVVL